ncbi:cellulose synthase A catalytic subunit 2 [UDP-forming]-like [Olea europaea subsp. europaea]|uniref:Cellulose synthase A catalytic subunit 2 [UDP-forming]-like n=1 Tax=Olea europaea subsp. europaea TaxID=158383 RepID=A0A8S0VAI0_OLEEU|nr:cellulose synthase A catalytic subunit 2 [UDP-forming]-like [Olea europaea subsp. europaea]
MRIKGNPRVDGDEDEDEFDGLDNEFDYNGKEIRDPCQIVDIGQNASGITIPSELDSIVIDSKIPLLTYAQEVD